MKLVIEIPEEQYRTLNAKSQNDVVAVIDDALLIAAIQHGTPLPEHHGRLIDIGKVELVDVAPMRAYDKGWHNAVKLCVETLRNAPTVLEATKEV